MSGFLEWLSQPGPFGTRGPIAADVVIGALVVVVPLFWWGASLAVSRAGRPPRLRLHAATMAALFGALSAVVVVFVIWARTHAPEAPHLDQPGALRTAYLALLPAHIAAALGTLVSGAGALLWALVFSTRAEDGSPRFGQPSRARVHRLVGRGFVWLVTLTALSGGVVYAFRYLA